MIQTPEEIMKEFANQHSYETWGELMYDCHEHSQIQYTKEVMEIYAHQVMVEIGKALDEKLCQK